MRGTQRTTPNDDDADLIAEILEEKYNIQTAEDFNESYDHYMRNENRHIRSKEAKAKVFEKYLSPKHIRTSKRNAILGTIGFKRKKSKVTGKPTKTKPIYKYNYLAKVGKRTVYARRVKTKKGTFNYYDSKGKRAKPISRKKVSKTRK